MSTWEKLESHCAAQQFAPRVESADFTFTAPTRGRVLQLKLSVHAVDGGLVYETPGGQEVDATAGLPLSLAWTGLCNRGGAPGGPARYVDPTRSPFAVEVWALVEPAPVIRPFADQVKQALGDVLRCIVSCGAGLPDDDDDDDDDVDDPLLAHAPAPVADAVIAVLYHSIELELVPWRDTYPGADKDHYPGAADNATRIDWVRYRLNDMGYFAGPATGVADPELTRALMRYRCNHGGALYQRLFDYLPDQDDKFVERPAAMAALADATFPADPADATAVLVGALEARTKAVPILSDAQVFARDDRPEAKLWVDNNVFVIDSDDASGRPDLNTIHQDTTSGAFVKAEREARWLTRPILPLQARVLVTRSDGAGVYVPEAVGPAQIHWSWAASPTAPDLPAPTTAQPSTIRGYVEATFAVMNAGAAAQFEHNAPTTAGGIVSSDAAATRAAAFAAYPGQPLDVAACMTTAALAAAATPADAPQGATRVYFRPSTIAGDSYRLSAELRPSDPAHAVAGATLVRHSSWLRVVRRVRISAHVGWPAHAIDHTVWDSVKQEFAHAFVEVDTANMAELTMDATIVAALGGQCGPGANDRSYYYHLNAKMPFSTLATYPAIPVMTTSLEAADALFITPFNQRDVYDWASTPSKDGKPASNDLRNAALLAGWYATQGGLRGQVGAHFKAQLDMRLESPPGPLIWQSPPAEAGPRSDRLEPLADGAVPADPLTALEDAVNTLVIATVNESLAGAPGAPEVARLVALRAMLNAGWRRDTLLNDATNYCIAVIDARITKQAGFPARYAVTTPIPNPAADYRLAPELVTNAIWGRVSEHCQKIGNVVDLDLQRHIRGQGLGDGLIYLDAMPHLPVVSQGRTYTYPGLNLGASGGLFMTSQFSRNDPVHLIAHEMAHCMFMRHYKNAGNHQPLEHDLADDNCIMSYGFNLGAVQVAAVWSATFGCYVLTATFRDNDGTPCQFDRLVTFTSSAPGLTLATFSADAHGQRRHAGTIKVLGGYEAKARLYVDTPHASITVTATALADTQGTTVINAPTQQAIAGDVAGFTDAESVAGPVRQLSGYGNAQHYHVPHAYRPHFCGKCNLVLRGWNLRAQDWPDRAP